MRDAGAALASLLGVLFVLAQVVFWGGTSLGVVREHCLQLPERPSGALSVKSSWTYIIWPPVIFANVDPPGHCVRNSPLREGLAQLGVWELGSPESQVREHIAKQLRGRARTRGRFGSSASTP